MCGIVGVLSLDRGDAHIRAVQQLKHLEYRGYDSFGYITEEFEPQKYIGAISKTKIELDTDTPTYSAIAHTRWATHGKVNLANTHPHLSHHNDFAIVHNGVISNAKSLKQDLEKIGYSFYSDTDTEVIANLLDRELRRRLPDRSPRDLVRSATAYLQGEYAFVVLSKAWPNTLVCVKHDSPLVVGISESLCIVASDEVALSENFENCLHLSDDEIMVVRRGEYKIYVDGPSSRQRYRIYKDNYESNGTDTFSDFMSKEMAETPNVITKALQTRIFQVPLEDRLLITGCGSAYYAAWIGQIMRRMGSPYVTDTLAYPADEAEHSLDLHVFDTVLAISQSGQTYDTLRALKGIPGRTSCITNSIGSTLYRSVDLPIYQDAGTERCVLSTKSIISQCVILYRMVSQDSPLNIQKNIERLSDIWPTTFYESSTSEKIQELACMFAEIDNFFHIGRGIYLPVAMENALKLKEVTYCHAEGMGAGFFKHGTLSLIDERFVVFAHLPNPQLHREKELHALTEANISEIEARGGTVIRVGHTEDCDIELPTVCPELDALLHLGVGQHFAYTMAKQLGRDVDQPRSLAKSVTVR